LTLAAGLLVAAFSSPVAADATTTDFEAFSLGSPDGQDGWSADGSAGSGCATYDHAIADPNSFGVTTMGDRALRMSNAVTSGCFGDQTFSKPVADEAGEADALNGGMSGGTRQRHFEVGWDFASTTRGGEQAGLTVVASPDRGDGARMSWVQLTDTPGGLAVNFFEFVDAAPFGGTGTETDGYGPEDDFQFTPVATGLDRTVPHSVSIAIDLIDGQRNDVVTVCVDGATCYPGTTWEDYFRFTQGPPAGPEWNGTDGTGSRTMDSILFRTGGAAAPGTLGGGFLIDNLSIETSNVPLTLMVDDDGLAAPGDCDDTAGAYSTIGAAAAAAISRDTVQVCPGTYAESPSITKSLTVESTDGPAVTTIDLQTGPTYLGSLTISGAGSIVTISGFTIEGRDADCGTSTLAASNIYVEGGPDSVSVLDNVIQVGEVGPCSNGDDGFGLITTYNDTAVNLNSLTVDGNTIEPLDAAGTRAFYINPGVDVFGFTDNTVSGHFMNRDHAGS
jgi:hypothetical protein